jgi:hypothetical protein
MSSTRSWGDPGWTNDDWDRLSERLFRRRIELDPSYATFKTFITERGNLSLYRTAWDAEHAVEQDRTNITLGTLITKIDPLYGYLPGGCEAILNGGEPVREEDARRRSPAGEPEEYTPEQVARIAEDFAKMIRSRTSDAGDGEDNGGKDREKPA